MKIALKMMKRGVRRYLKTSYNIEMQNLVIRLISHV
jgi:hypothetical protein